MKYFNYQEQLLLWEKNQLLLQKKYADTPPGISSGQDYDTSWQEWKAKYDLFLENGRHKISDTPLPSVPINFTGREEELAAVHDMLNSFRTAFLYGMGGIGKTSIALQYMTDYGHLYDHVLYVLTDKDIVQAICDDTAISISGLVYDRKKYPVLRQYFKEKLCVLKELSAKNKILIVIDNLNTPEDKNLSLFLDLPCHKIITTRINYAFVPKEEKLCIKSLAPKHWNGLIAGYSNHLTPPEMEQLIYYAHQVNGHTLSLKMASVQASYGEFSEAPGTGFDVTSLLSSFRLKKTALKALLYLSVLAPQGMERELFVQLSGTSDKTLQILRNYLLIDFIALGKTGDQENGTTLLRVHPLIAEAVKKIMPPTCINCSHLLRGFETYLYGDDLGKIGTWNRSYEENRKMEPHIFALYKTFPDPAPWLGTAFEEIITFMWVQDYYKEALAYALKLYENILDYYGPNHVMPGREALRVAAVYHNHMDHDHALTWYRKGYDMLKAVTPKSFDVLDQLNIVCGKLAREARRCNDPASFQKYCNEYQQLLDSFFELRPDTLSDKQKQRIEFKWYIFYANEARYALQDGDIALAKKLFSSVEKWASKQQNLGYRREILDEVHISLLIHDGLLEDAEKAAREFVKSTLLYRGEKYKDSLSKLELLADILKLENKNSEAHSVYVKILIHLQSDYPYMQNWIDSIMNKIQNTQF